MAKVPVTNDTPNVMFIGSYMLPAGETREFEENEVPEHLRPQTAEEAADTVKTPEETEEEGIARETAEAAAKRKEELAEISKGKAADLIKALPGLSDQDLSTIEELEKARQGTLGIGGPRKTVLEAISAEQLKRAGGGASEA